MATTTNLAIELADVGADNGTWGNITNAAFQSLDDIFKTDATGTAVSLNVGASRTLNAASGTLLLPAANSPAQTANGSVVWDSDDDVLTVGTGAGRKTMCDTDSTQTLTNKAITATSLALSTGAILAGTYTPTATNISGTSGFTVSAANYIRVGAAVTVSGSVSFTAAFASACQFTLTLPVASNFTATAQLAGCGGLSVGPGATIVADITGDVAQVTFIPGVTGAMSLSYSYTYTVA